MQLIRKSLAFGQLPSSKGDIYTPTAGSKGLVHNIVLHNTNTTDETVVIYYHDGTDEFEILNQTLTAGETLIWSFKGAGDIVESGGKYTGSTTTASKVTYKVDGTEESPSSSSQALGLESNLWAPPASPHPQNDEFLAETLSGWAVRNATDGTDGSFSYGTVDAYDTTFNTGDVIRVNTQSGRASWALLQTPARSKHMSIYKAYTLPTNLLVVARMKFNQLRTSRVNDDGTIALGLVEATAGKPTVNSRIEAQLNLSISSDIVAAAVHVTSTGTETPYYTGDAASRGQPLEYVAIHKIGGTFHVWVGTASGNWIWINSFDSLDFTPDTVAIRVENAGTQAPGVHIVGIDFVRFYETDKFLQ